MGKAPPAPPLSFEHVGVVEGFYGPVWGHAARLKFIDDLRPFGLNTYVYAPKHDALLGADLMGQLTEDETERLRPLTRSCQARGIRLLAGLHLGEPFELTNAAHHADVAAKCGALAELGFTGFALLFDDVPTAQAAGSDSLAKAQARALVEIRRHVEWDAGASIERTGAAHLNWWVCPSQYTLDPLLAKEWGPFEPGYLATLHAGLPADVPWFWTGPRVCSPTVSLADLRAWQGAGSAAAGSVAAGLVAARPVVLWDNYPVNDISMQHDLHLGPLSGRAGDLPVGIRGYLLNPMLQPALGAIPAATALQYAADPARYRPAEAWRRALEALLPNDARAPFAALEALTRRSCLAPPTEPLGPGLSLESKTAAGLVARVEAAWNGVQAGSPIPEALLRELADVLAAADGTLPDAMQREAEPWLRRLRQAHALMGTHTPPNDPHAPEADNHPRRLEEREMRRAAWLAEKTRVLEPWFKPEPVKS